MEKKCIKIFLLTAFNLCSLYIIGQTTVISDDYLIETRTDYQWTINGVSFSPTSKKTKIYPHKQDWDTIIFTDTYFKYNRPAPDTIISRIPKNKKYVMSIGCCDEFFEMRRTDKKYPYVDIDTISFKDFQTLTSQDYGQVKFVILNKLDTDTLICMYSGCGSSCPIGQMITDNSDNGWLIPMRTGYSNTNGIVMIIKKNKELEYGEFEELEYDEDLGRNLVYISMEADWNILKKFHLKLFNQEKVIIEYDYFTKATKLTVVE